MHLLNKTYPASVRLTAAPTVSANARSGLAPVFGSRRQPRFACRVSESLIPQTLEDMEEDSEFQLHLAELKAKGQAALTREERVKRQRSLDTLGVPSFYAMSKEKGVKPLVRKPAAILQLNIGLYCNQACTHCHVESSPKRTEMMDRKTAERCVELMKLGVADGSLSTVDITGGAPEMNAYLVEEARALGLEVIDRCNLTVLMEPGWTKDELPAFLANNKVRVVASLPCYGAEKVDKQRGAGVFERSIEALKILNNLGYGVPGSGLGLDLVYNPSGDFLAPAQAKLEALYRVELKESHGIVFNSLFCLNNMPIKRFADFLLKRNKMDDYMQLLVNSFNPSAADGVMCRDTVSVGWDGRMYDCDFNQQLELPVQLGAAAAAAAPGGPTVFDIASLADLTGRPILCDNHCYGCTAGAGSSCQGSTE
eukprot:gene30330-35323_t